MKNESLSNFSLPETVTMLGPPLEEGPMPACFYFALSKDDSLNLPPFNTFPLHLQKKIRVFSMTIPGHEKGLKKELAITYWKEKLLQDNNIIKTFSVKAAETIKLLKKHQFITTLTVAGLSRGAFIAAHVALETKVDAILGFAPVTNLNVLRDFQDKEGNPLNSPLIESLNLNNYIEEFSSQKIRFYLGNFDTRVDTTSCYTFIHDLAKKALEKRIKPPPFELFLTPAIGRDGHGTSDETFLDGAKWILSQ